MLMQETARLVLRAKRMGADLVCFPECYPQLATGDVLHHAEAAEGGTLQEAMALAAEQRLHLVWPRLEYNKERGLRNVAWLLGPEGQAIGRYEKMFPTVGELEAGVIPGADVPCFETDFGRIGMLICFDLNFPEVRERLAAGKPDVVLFPSMYRGGLQAQALAFELGSFVVTAVSGELGLIIDRCGRILKESTYETLAVARINTNSVALHMDFNAAKLDEMLERYGSELNIDHHTREAFLVIEREGNADVAGLVAEFELESAGAYFDRSRKARAEALGRWSKN
jgi:predicted amidohydrolase